MRIFVAGASGAIGKRLVPLLVARGHDVVAMTRAPASGAALRQLGAEPAIADGLDRTAVVQAVMRAEPEVIVHQMTALAGVTSLKRFDDEFAVTNRLRTEGTDNLLEGASRAGADRIVAQSFGNWNYERTGDTIKTEEDPLDPNPPASMRKSLDAIRHVEAAVLDAGGTALRYANLYGPGTGWALDGSLVDLLRARKLPVVGDGAGVWSFVHVDDAALATVSAIERSATGVYNVADDEPVPVGTVLPYLADVLGAKPPRRVPAWLGRFAVGDAGVSLFTRIRGAANDKAKRELDWRLAYPSWRQGFREGLAETPVDPVAAERFLERQHVDTSSARRAG